MKYKLKSYSNYTNWMEPYTELYKYVPIEEFIEVNPSFTFNMNIKNPLKVYKNIYDKYVKGNIELEEEYNKLNKYYCEKLISFFHDDVIPLIKEKIDKNITTQIYHVF